MKRCMALTYLLRTNYGNDERDVLQVLLGLKKRGFGEGKWNGFGGHIEEGESPEDAAIREFHEEAGIRVHDLHPRGNLLFMFPHKPEDDCKVHIFTTTAYTGTPTESEEMRPKWWDVAFLPLTKMWADDHYWLIPILTLPDNWVIGSFVFQADNSVSAGFLQFTSHALL